MSDILDPLGLDRVRNGSFLATFEALSRIYDALNSTITTLDRFVAKTSLTPLYCRLYRSSGVQSIPDSTLTALLWDTPSEPGTLIDGVNVGGMFDPNGATVGGVTGPGYVTLKEPGLYLVEANIQWDTNTPGLRDARITLLGSSAALTFDRETPHANGLRQALKSLLPWSGVGSDWSGQLAVQVSHNSGTARDVATAGAGVVADHWHGVTRIAGV